ncbi:hypothetical protein DSM100238_1846 [Bifidobacterium apri]|uniref:Uncharacterized protein n=1 Tax=Bifidobacterium apri TaxID=1769423 RepID=A0A6A2VT02_9BIFI|nr:hypothetical protein DSM100238_1846 [Bifidobacterium apri]
MPRISRLAGADDAVCEDWLTKCVVGGVGICCFAGLCARFVRIRSQSGWFGMPESTVLAALVLGL